MDLGCFSNRFSIGNIIVANEDSKTLKVLFVDDDMWTCDLVKECFSKSDFYFTFVNHAAEGLAALKSNTFDVAFLDFMLDGFYADAILFSLRKVDIKTKVYLITGHRRDDILDRIGVLKSTIVEVISKKDLITNIEQVLKTKIK